MKKVMSFAGCVKLIVLISMAVLLFAAQSWGIPANVLSDYDGNYAGSYSGDDNGIWVALLDSDKGIWGILLYSTDQDTLDIGDLDDMGEVSAGVRQFNVETDLNETTIVSEFTLSSGAVEGEWSNSTDEGDVTGGLITSISYAGTYTGTFSGDQSGTWNMTIAADGLISGTATNNSIGASVTIVGGAHPDGHIMAVGVTMDGDELGDPVSIFYGTVAGLTASGSWSNLNDANSGTFITDSSGGSNDDDDDSSCFINSIID